MADAALTRETATARPARLLIQWHVTERCNLRCAHCYQESYRDIDGMSGWLPILERLRAFLAGPPRTPGQITVTGGEPFAHPEFPALLETLAGHREEFGLAILSNGTLIDADLARRLAAWRPRFVQVSIEGGRATHDAVRGAGSHARAVAGIERLVAAGVRTFIAFTAHRGNYREFGEVAQLGRRLKVARVWADRLIPQGNGEALGSLTPAETAGFIESMRAARERRPLADCFGARTEIALHRALQFQGGGPAYQCSAGDTLITVMPDGTLYPCRRLPIAAGNLRETPLAELYDGPLFRRLRDPQRVAEGCAECAFERICRGGLRCLGYALTGSLHVADPGCPLAAATATAPATAAPATAPTAATGVA